MNKEVLRNEAIITGQVRYVHDGYSARGKTQRTVRVRAMTLDEIKDLAPGRHAKVIANDGKLREVKINGVVKRWKREPDRVSVSVKYGMYEFAHFDTDEALRRFVVVLDD
jgi:hypothetical protein